MSGDMLACICDSGEHRRDTWASVNLSKSPFSVVSVHMRSMDRADVVQRNGLLMEEGILSVLEGRETECRLRKYLRSRKPLWTLSWQDSSRRKRGMRSELGADALNI